MRIAVPLDQPAAMDDFDTKCVIIPRAVERKLIPALEMIHFYVMAQKRAAPAAQAANAPEHGEARHAVRPDMPAAIDAPVHPGKEFWPLFDIATERERQRAAEFFRTRMKILGQLQYCRVIDTDFGANPAIPFGSRFQDNP